MGLHALLLSAWNNQSIRVTPFQADIRLKLDAYVTRASAAAQPAPPPAVEKTKQRAAQQKVIATQLPAKAVIQTAVQPVSTPVKHVVSKPRPQAVSIEPRADNKVKTAEAEHNRLSTRIQQQLHARLEFFHHYPRMAIRKSWEGQVDLGIRVQANGELGKVYVIQSSGYNLLDKAAISSVHKVAVLPEASFWLNGQHIDVILPVIYKLSDNRS